jgi:hypothetical protein
LLRRKLPLYREYVSSELSYPLHKESLEHV